MKYNPSRIFYIIVISASIFGVLIFSLKKESPKENVKAEINQPSTKQITDGSGISSPQLDLNSVKTPMGEAAMAEPDTTPYTPEQIAAIEAEIAKMFPPAPDIDVARITEFNSWAERYLAATPEQRAEMEKEGVAMATARRPEFLKMIKSDPQRALEMALPRVVRQDLPESITELLEQPVSAKGDL